MPHYTTFDVNPEAKPAQVITVPRASVPVPPKLGAAPQSTPVGTPAGNQSAGGNGGLIGNGSADVTVGPIKPMASPSGMAKDGARAGLVPVPPPPVSEKTTKSEDVCVSVGRRVSVGGCADL